MAKFKLTPVQTFRLVQANEAIKAVADEFDASKVKGDGAFALLNLKAASGNILEALLIANPPAPAKDAE